MSRIPAWSLHLQKKLLNSNFEKGVILLKEAGRLGGHESPSDLANQSEEEIKLIFDKYILDNTKDKNTFNGVTHSNEVDRINAQSEDKNHIPPLKKINNFVIRIISKVVKKH